MVILAATVGRSNHNKANSDNEPASTSFTTPPSVTASNPPHYPPSDMPKGTYTRDPNETRDIFSTLTNQLGSTYFQYSQDVAVSAYQVRDKALHWLLAEDPMQLKASDDNLLQRFVMILLYLQTTQSSHWKECNPPTHDNPLCYHPLGLYYDEPSEAPIWGHRWLSNFTECMWAGIVCDRETKKVITIELGK